MNRKIKISIFLLLLVLGGCATIEPVRPGKVEHIFEKDYSVGTVLFAKVGEPIITVKDFYVAEGQGVQPSDDFTIRARNLSFSGYASTIYPIVGETKIKDKKFLVIRTIGYHGVYGLLIDDKGNLYTKKVINLTDPYYSYIPLINVSIDPPDLKFFRVKRAVYSTEKGYINFEILYNGVSKDSLKLLYREYTKDNLARPAFYQNLTYDKTENIISFRDIKIKVIKADNTGIKYIILKDPYKEKKVAGKGKIGVLIKIGDKNGFLYPVIVKVLENGPAKKAGLQKGDIITEVNSKPTKGMSTFEVIELITGKPGTPVSLKVERNGKEFEVTIIREEISQW